MLKPDTVHDCLNKHVTAVCSTRPFEMLRVSAGKLCLFYLQALATVGLGDKERLNIYTTVAAVLHLGNVAFEDNPEDRKGEEDTQP